MDIMYCIVLYCIVLYRETVYLPLQVLCELELHKEEGQNTRVRARAVVRWINSLRQRSRQKELWIQSSAQQKFAIKSHSSKECSGPEDKILATCLFLQKEDKLGQALWARSNFGLW